MTLSRSFLNELRVGFCGRWGLQSALTAVVLLVCVLAGSKQLTAQDASKQADSVSLVRLLANGAHYEGKKVRVIGFLSLDFEGEALYLHEDDYRHGISQNSLALRVSRKEIERYRGVSRRYVILEGVYFGNGPEREDFGGALGRVTRLEEWKFNITGPIPR